VSYTLTAPGITAPIAINDPISAAERKLPPTIMVSTANTTGADGNLSYSIEATADDVHAPGYNPASGAWAPAPISFAWQGYGTGPFSSPLTGIVSAVRLRVATCLNGAQATIAVAQG
jgi:hypothetical protein